MQSHAWNIDLDLLSAAEAQDFAENRGIDLTKSRLQVLNAVTKAVSAMPFHNLHFLAAAPDDRQPPSAEEVKSIMLKGQGGLCFVKQPFVAHLLKALGYAVEVVPGAVSLPGDHVVIIVHDVEETGDRYLVEAGCGFPSCQAVRIDGGPDGFEHVFHESVLEFRYVQAPGESLIRREHRRGDPPRPVLADSLGREAEGDGWRRFLDVFYPAISGTEQLVQGMRVVCTIPDASPFLTSLRAVRWVDSKMIAIKDSTLLQEEDDGKVAATELQDANGIREKLGLHFPEIETRHVDAALEFWQRHIHASKEAG